MKPENAFIAERPIARHCPELLREGPSDEALTTALDATASRLARALGEALAPLFGGTAPSVTPDPSRALAGEELVRLIAPLAANSIFALGTDARMLASVEAAAVLLLVDRAFGGKGEAPSVLPSAFPASADLMIARIEARIGEALAATLGAALGSVAPLRRGGEFAELNPWSGDARLALLAFDVMEGMQAPWQLKLALPLAALVPLATGRPAPQPRPTPAPSADPAAPPFADLPLPLRAVLVEARLPLATVSALEPGVVLPVAVARAVPITIGETVIARGTIGAADDRVALKLTDIA